MSQPRTWTLTYDGHYTNAALEGDYNQPNGVGFESVWVIELDPVLTLLESVMLVTKEGLENGVCLTVEEREVAALLRAHGRFEAKA
jgi:hypothetical protein